ncbi:MAG: hypothetical protein WC551_04500 [Patescibacteria group bacterium]
MPKTKNLNQTLADMDDSSREKLFDLAVDFPEVLPALDEQARMKSLPPKQIDADKLLELERKELEDLTRE